MSTQSHLVALEQRHAELERQIEKELSFSAPDEMHIATLKRKKLEVKDEMARKHARDAA